MIFCTSLSKAFLILRNQLVTIRNLHRSSHKVPIILVGIKFEFPRHVFEKFSNIKFHENLTKICWVILQNKKNSSKSVRWDPSCFMRMDGQTDI